MLAGNYIRVRYGMIICMGRVTNTFVFVDACQTNAPIINANVSMCAYNIVTVQRCVQ